jgi:hypothetical protein
MKLKPLNDRVLIKRIASETQSAGGIIIPSPTPSRSPSAPRAATSSSRRASAPPRSPRTASPSPRRSSSKTSSRTWAPRWSRRSPPRPPTSPATAPPPPPCSPRRSSARAEARRRRRTTRWRSSAASTRPSRWSSPSCQALSKPTKDQRRRSPRSAPSPPTATRPSARSSPRPWTRSARKASSPSRKPRAIETTLDVVEGMQFDRGYLSPYFVTDPSAWSRPRGPLHPHHEKKISNMKDLLPVLEQVAKSGKPLLIIAEDVDGEALATLVVNKLRGTLKVAPSRRRASATAARPCWRTSPSSPAAGHQRGPRHQARERHPRRSRHRQAITIDKDNTTIVDGAGKKRTISGPGQADPRPDRGDHLRLRPREAAGAPGQAGRRRGRHQGRRGHRDRDEGEEGPRRGRPARDPRGRRRGHRPRRRRGPAARPPPQPTRSRRLRRSSRVGAREA